jgi:hypothetical protein
MADIFISYSKADHDLALKLATYLESRAWSVWWDKSLKPADTFRDEIMKQLVAARAVIVIWSNTSIKSEWVRAEAGRAKAEGKLIPVKTADVDYADIPLPFGEMHTENIGANELIRAAVIAQLTKPAIPSSPIRQITKAFKYEVLTWMGIIGGAMTLFSNIGRFLNLSDVARKIVIYWHEWMAAFWIGAFGWLGLHVPKLLTPVLSFTLFITMLLLGSNLTERIRPVQPDMPTRPVKRRALIFLIGALLYVALFFFLAFRGDSVLPGVPAEVLLMSLVLVWTAFPTAFMTWVLSDKWWTVAGALTFYTCGLLLLFPYNPWRAMSVWRRLEGPTRLEALEELNEIFFSIVFLAFLIPIGWMAIRSFTPIRIVTRRLARLPRLLVGVLILFALSEISKLNLRPFLELLQQQSELWFRQELASLN